MNFKSRIDLLQLLVFLIYFSTLTFHVKSDFFRGLNFTQKHHKLIDIGNKLLRGTKTIGNDIATACPVQFPEEVKFNLNHSFGKNSLFVRSVYKADQNPAKVDNEICSDIYKVSIYYDSSEFNGFKNSNYGDFDSITKAYSWRRHWARKIGLVKSKPILKKKTGPVPLNFVWITLSELVFDDEITRVSRVRYTLSKTMEIGAKCRNYTIGDELYLKKKIDVHSLYKNQAKTFKNIQIPESDSGCEIHDQCLTKWSLTTPERFRTRSPEPTRISCSNLATVAIWRSTINGVLRKLEQFLTALALIVYADLKITSGVRGELVMPLQGSRNTKKITLGDGEIPVPNIIYKVVMYECKVEVKKEGIERPVQSTISKAIIIVFYNDPYFDKENALCSQENCDEWGWSEILNENIPSSKTSSEYVYCCPKNREVVEKLGMEYDEKEAQVLSLSQFPKYDKTSKEIEIESIELDIIDKMTKLAKKKMKKREKNGLQVIDEDEGENTELTYQSYEFKPKNEKNNNKG